MDGEYAVETRKDFLSLWRNKYPGAYDQVPDDELYDAIIKKYPVYAQQIRENFDSSVTPPSPAGADPSKPAEMPEGWVGRPLRADIASIEGGEDYLKLMDKNRNSRRGFVEGLMDVGADDIPFVGEFFTANEIRKALSTYKKLDRNEEVTDEELLGFNRWLATNRRLENATWAGKAGDAVRGSIRFALEIAAIVGSGGSLLGAKVGTKIGAKAAKEAGETFLEKAALEMGQDVVEKSALSIGKKAAFNRAVGEAGVREARQMAYKAVREKLMSGIPKRILEKKGSRAAVDIAAGALVAGAEIGAKGLVLTALNPGLVQSKTAEQQLRQYVNSGNEDYGRAVAMGFMDAFVENSSEMAGWTAGKLAGRILPLPVREAMIKSKIFQIVEGKVGNEAVRAWVQRAGVGGVLEEMYEERLGGFAAGMLGLRGDDRAGLGKAIETMLPSIDQIRTEMLAFSIPGIAMATHGYLRGTEALGGAGWKKYEQTLSDLNMQINPQTAPADRVRLAAERDKVVDTLADLAIQQNEPGLVDRMLKAKFGIERTRANSVDDLLSRMNFATTRQIAVMSKNRGESEEIQRKRVKEHLSNVVGRNALIVGSESEKAEVQPLIKSGNIEQIGVGNDVGWAVPVEVAASVPGLAANGNRVFRVADVEKARAELQRQTPAEGKVSASVSPLIPDSLSQPIELDSGLFSYTPETAQDYSSSVRRIGKVLNIGSYRESEAMYQFLQAALSNERVRTDGVVIRVAPAMMIRDRAGALREAGYSIDPSIEDHQIVSKIVGAYNHRDEEGRFVVTIPQGARAVDAHEDYLEAGLKRSGLFNDPGLAVIMDEIQTQTKIAADANPDDKNLQTLSQWWSDPRSRFEALVKTYLTGRLGVAPSQKNDRQAFGSVQLTPAQISELDRIFAGAVGENMLKRINKTHEEIAAQQQPQSSDNKAGEQKKRTASAESLSMMDEADLAEVRALIGSFSLMEEQRLADIKAHPIKRGAKRISKDGYTTYMTNHKQLFIMEGDSGKEILIDTMLGIRASYDPSKTTAQKFYVEFLPEQADYIQKKIRNGKSFLRAKDDIRLMPGTRYTDAVIRRQGKTEQITPVSAIVPEPYSDGNGPADVYPLDTLGGVEHIDFEYEINGEPFDSIKAESTLNGLRSAYEEAVQREVGDNRLIPTENGMLMTGADIIREYEALASKLDLINYGRLGEDFDMAPLFSSGRSDKAVSDARPFGLERIWISPDQVADGAVSQSEETEEEVEQNPNENAESDSSIDYVPDSEEVPAKVRQQDIQTVNEASDIFSIEEPTVAKPFEDAPYPVKVFLIGNSTILNMNASEEALKKTGGFSPPALSKFKVPAKNVGKYHLPKGEYITPYGAQINAVANAVKTTHGIILFAGRNLEEQNATTGPGYTKDKNGNKTFYNVMTETSVRKGFDPEKNPSHPFYRDEGNGKWTMQYDKPRDVGLSRIVSQIMKQAITGRWTQKYRFDHSWNDFVEETEYPIQSTDKAYRPVLVIYEGTPDDVAEGLMSEFIRSIGTKRLTLVNFDRPVTESGQWMKRMIGRFNAAVASLHKDYVGRDVFAESNRYHPLRIGLEEVRPSFEPVTAEPESNADKSVWSALDALQIPQDGTFSLSDADVARTWRSALAAIEEARRAPERGDADSDIYYSRVYSVMRDVFNAPEGERTKEKMLSAFRSAADRLSGINSDPRLMRTLRETLTLAFSGSAKEYAEDSAILQEEEAAREVLVKAENRFLREAMKVRPEDGALLAETAAGPGLLSFEIDSLTPELKTFYGEIEAAKAKMRELYGDNVPESTPVDSGTFSLMELDALFSNMAPESLHGSDAMRNVLLKNMREYRVFRHKANLYSQTIRREVYARFDGEKGRGEKGRAVLRAIGARLENPDAKYIPLRPGDITGELPDGRKTHSVEYENRPIADILADYDANKPSGSRSSSEIIEDLKAQNEKMRQEINRLVSGYSDGEWIRYLENYIMHRYKGANKKTAPRFARRYAETTGREEKRKLPTYEDAIRMGLTPLTMDAAELHSMWAEDVGRVALNKLMMNAYGAMTDIDGAPLLVAVPTREETEKPVLSKETYRQMINNASDWLGIARPAGSPVEALKSLGDKIRLTQEYELLDSPFESLSAIYVRKGQPSRYVKMFIGQPFKNKPMQILEHLNQWMKWLAIGIPMTSMFHPFALLESFVATQGLKNNPVLTGAKDILTGKKPRIFKQMDDMMNGILKNPELADVWIRAGLGIDFSHPDLKMGMIDKDLRSAVDFLRSNKSVPAGEHIAKGLEKFNAFKSRWDNWMWNSFQPALKLYTAQGIYIRRMEEAEKNGTYLDPDLLRQDIADYVNDAYGGQEWEKYWFATPKVMQMMHLITFAPDWTISSANAAGMGNLPIIRQVVGKESTALHVDELIKNYWPAMILIVLAGIPNAIQFAIWTATRPFGDPDDKPFTFMNEAGRKTYVDVTPIYRMLGYGTGDQNKRRVYLRWGKQAYEVLRWFTNPVESAMSKSSQTVKIAMEQVTGSSGNGFELPFADKGLMGALSVDGSFWDSRIGYVARHFVPYSVLNILDGYPVGYFANVTRGPSKFRLIDDARQILEAYGNSDEYSLIEQMGKTHLLKDRLGDVLHSAELNGYDSEEVYTRALAMVRTKYYGDFFKALNDGDNKKTEQIAEAIVRLNGTVKELNRSMEKRFSAVNKEWDPAMLPEGVLRAYDSSPSP